MEERAQDDRGNETSKNGSGELVAVHTGKEGEVAYDCDSDDDEYDVEEEHFLAELDRMEAVLSKAANAAHEGGEGVSSAVFPVYDLILRPALVRRVVSAAEAAAASKPWQQLKPWPPHILQVTILPEGLADERG